MAIEKYQIFPEGTKVSEYLRPGLRGKDRDRVERLLTMEHRYVPKEEFDQRNHARKFLCGLDVDVTEAAQVWDAILSERGADGSKVRISPQNANGNKYILTPKEEKAIFLRFSYCKYRLALILKQAPHKPLTVSQQRQILQWDHRIAEIRTKLVVMNLALVLKVGQSIYFGENDDRREMTADARDALLRSVECFDPTRGFKFSTYAWHSIKKGYIRNQAKRKRHLVGQFSIGHDDHTDFYIYHEDMDKPMGIRQTVEVLYDPEVLTDTERQILYRRYYKDETLQNIGNSLGVTKERIRQLQCQAEEKMRVAMGAYEED